MTNVNIRELVIGILMEVNENGTYSHLYIRGVLDKYQYLDKKERAFITRVSEGTIENQILIDYIIDTFSKVKVKKMKPFIRNLLRMSVYQLKFMDSIPNSAVCNEAVKLAAKRGFSSLKGFVNGVLRNISRNLETIQFPSREEDEELYLSVMYSMPKWIVNNWLNVYGGEKTEKILKAFLENDSLTIRCNISKITVDDLISRLNEEDITVRKVPYLDYALKISDYDYIGKIKCFQEGLFQIQDISSMLVVECAGVKQNDYIIDVCAAPGGKSIHVADKLETTGHVEARDLTENKVLLIEENIERSGFKNIEAKIKDALVLDEEAISKADIVIADLPCSGLGIIGKKTDIKYKISEDKLSNLVQLQRDILQVVQEYVKPGGILMYSTCTINNLENEDNAKWFESNFSFKLESLNSYLGDTLANEDTENGCIQFLPGLHQTDGFFIAKFRKENNL